MAWGDQRASMLVLGIICLVILNAITTTQAQATDGKEDKKLQRLDQNAASPELDDGTLTAIRNILPEEERLLRYLNTVDTWEYEPIMQKRSCLRRAASCDARPHDCCEYLACRCNLWGTNCRCQRAGLLQRLG